MGLLGPFWRTAKNLHATPHSSITCARHTDDTDNGSADKAQIDAENGSASDTGSDVETGRENIANCVKENKQGRRLAEQTTISIR